MCLFTSQPAEIAVKPIIVYKVLVLTPAKEYSTPCQGNIVKVNDILKASVSAEPTEICINNKSIFVIEGEGVHAYTSKAFAKQTSLFYHVITKWEIPAGAKYWLGTDECEGEIAATEMKFIKVCEDLTFFSIPFLRG